MDTKKDISTRKDIELLINHFYKRVQENALLAPIFANVNWPSHLPTMYNFWSSMILGEQTYQGNPFQKHLPLNIDHTHFTEWLTLFCKTVDENFQGKTAEEIKMRAQSIAKVFQYKMGI